jgi:outer membrane protein OmpA-like peptidoglycan-associated protein
VHLKPRLPEADRNLKEARVMKIRTKLTLLATCGLVLVGCSNPREGAITGAVVGGLVGATRPNSSILTTATGAALGAAAGGAIGSVMERQAADLKRDINNPNVGVVNTGNELVVTMPQDILFATSSAAISPAARADLLVVAESLKKYPDTNVQVIGHTDNTGSAAYNLDLSQRRASAVASVLIQGGVPSSRITVIGRGEDMPVATNLTPEGRAQNRRVEIIIRPKT